MMDFTVIGRSFRDIPEDETEDFYSDQLDTFYTLFPDPVPCMLVFSNGNEYSAMSYDIPEYVDALSIKEGVDIVKWETGNYGFVGIDGSLINGFEIIPE